jgi:hypothetical protein
MRRKFLKCMKKDLFSCCWACLVKVTKLEDERHVETSLQTKPELGPAVHKTNAGFSISSSLGLSTAIRYVFMPSVSLLVLKQSCWK